MREEDIDVVDYLRDHAGHDEKEFTRAHRADGYKAFDNMAVELEVAELLISLVRAIKPTTIYETGSGQGWSTLALAAGCKGNGFGEVYAWEVDPKFRTLMTARCRGYPVFALEDSFGPDPDMVFLDSGPAFRTAEIDRWMNEKVFLIIHDSYRYELPGGFTFRTPRGLWIRDTR